MVVAAILMDMQMPRMGGIEACRCIRTVQGGERIPIIALTANVLTADVNTCIQAGMNGHIAKVTLTPHRTSPHNTTQHRHV